jgi:hypothetical protein
VEQERNEKGVTGREIYGITNVNMQGGDQPHDFSDIDGDGIPG